MWAVDPLPQAQILERGSLLFLYRPKADVAHAQGAADVEHLYLMLMPDDRERHKSRVYLLSGISLPSPASGERATALALDVDPDPRVAIDDLQEQAAQAPGPPWARIAGEGRYATFKHQVSTYLAYVLDRPEQPGPVQQALHIEGQGNFQVWAKAPTAPSQFEQARQPLYPSRLKNRFVGYEQVPLEPTDLLDYAGTQILLAAADPQAKHALGLRLERDGQNQRERQALQLLHKEERRAAQEGVALFEPMAEGHWA